MKSRQYYLDTNLNSIYHVDLCHGDYNDCLDSISKFIDNFSGNSMLYLSTNLDKLDLINKVIPENIRNYFVIYADVGNIKNLIDFCDRFHTRKYQDWQIVGTKLNNRKIKQKVFNITKNYVRELKIKRVLNET